MTLTFDAARALVSRPGGMDEPAARGFLDLLMGGTLAPEHGGVLLAALAERGETGVEVAAVVRGLLERAARVDAGGDCLDLCGTGGSGLVRYNVSTTAAFALAGAGVRVAKHGNRGSVKPNGSFDLLDALGVPFALPPPALARLIAETGVGFLFARAMHPAVAAVAPYRKAAGRRTIFNLAGPLANPCRPSRQIIGVSSWRTAEVMADALSRLGAGRALVVLGDPGIDEISVSGRTRWIEVTASARREGSWSHPAGPVDYATLPGGDAPDNARVFHELLAGGSTPGLRAMVAANIAAALDLWHDRAVLADTARLAEAEHLLSGGATRAAFERHRDAAQALAKASASA